MKVYDGMEGYIHAFLLSPKEVNGEMPREKFPCFPIGRGLCRRQNPCGLGGQHKIRDIVWIRTSVFQPII